MGQAAAPKSTSESTAVPIGPAPASNTPLSADDLLAQLAGEEIDRLLAETDDEPLRPVPTAVAEPSPTLAPTPAPASESPASDAPAPEAPASAIDSSINAVEKMGDQLDALLKEIESPEKSKAPEAEPEVPAGMVTIAQLGATTNNEVSALLGDDVAGADDSIADDGSPLPAYVRALEIVNAPFDAMPNAFRELLGKVAILTLFNSIAVLLYVLIFRRN